MDTLWTLVGHFLFSINTFGTILTYLSFGHFLFKIMFGTNTDSFHKLKQNMKVDICFDIQSFPVVSVFDSLMFSWGTSSVAQWDPSCQVQRRKLQRRPDHDGDRRKGPKEFLVFGCWLIQFLFYSFASFFFEFYVFWIHFEKTDFGFFSDRWNWICSIFLHPIFWVVENTLADWRFKFFG